jgi:Gram-negative bacterial TonB protein C-terminal
VAQLGRAPASGAGGRGFKSHQPDKKRINEKAEFRRLADSVDGMLPTLCTRSKITVAIIALLQAVLLSSHAVEIDVCVGHPPGVIKFVYPQYPARFAPYAWSGKGLFLLKVNPRTGDVDEVKVLKTTSHVLLNEIAAKAFFQWKFQPGGPTQVQVPCEFYAHGFSRDLH